MMEQGEEKRRPHDEPAVGPPHDSWVERYLGDGWTEVEPGIYRFTPPGDATATGSSKSEPTNSSADDLANALDSAQPSKPSRRPASRWRIRR